MLSAPLCGDITQTLPGAWAPSWGSYKCLGDCNQSHLGPRPGDTSLADMSGSLTLQLGQLLST